MNAVETQIQSRWLPIVRLVWILLLILLATTFVAGLGPRVRELARPCSQEPCPVLTLAPEEGRVLEVSGFSLQAYAAFHIALEMVTASTLGLLAIVIFWRRSHDWIGILVSLALLFFGLNFMVETDGALVHANPALNGPNDLLSSIGIVLFILLLYLFPDGKLVPRWSGVAAAIFAGVVIIDPLLPVRSPIVPSGQMSMTMLVATLAALILGVFTQIYRYLRVSGPVQRQQTKWVVLGLIALLVTILFWSLGIEFFPVPGGRPRLLFYTVGFMVIFPILLLFPVSLGVSILRYRLWDIDLVLNRALVYSILTALLAGTYFATVVLLQFIFRSLTGQGNTLAIVISTLAIAALFMPLRNRIQEVIDRRFFRRRYDMEQALAALHASIRDKLDMETLSEELLQVVDETMQPEHASIWLRARR